MAPTATASRQRTCPTVRSGSATAGTLTGRYFGSRPMSGLRSLRAPDAESSTRSAAPETGPEARNLWEHREIILPQRQCRTRVRHPSRGLIQARTLMPLLSARTRVLGALKGERFAVLPAEPVVTGLYWTAATLAVLWAAYTGHRLRRDRSALVALSALCMLAAASDALPGSRHITYCLGESGALGDSRPAAGSATRATSGRV